MSKTSQRKLSMFCQGYKDYSSGSYLRPRWIKHPLKSVYMAGWCKAKRDLKEKYKLLTQTEKARVYFYKMTGRKVTHIVTTKHGKVKIV